MYPELNQRNAVAPGLIDTDMTRDTAQRLGLNPEQMKAGAASHVPLRRVGLPEDIANVVTFLCSDESSFISGRIIYVCGGPSQS